jgi:hypothetical protein
METLKENIIKAYNIAKETGADSTCKVLEALYPNIEFTSQDNRPVTERIKTFEDAIKALGEDHIFVLQYKTIVDELRAMEQDNNAYDTIAYLKLRIIAAALNEGWTPKFTEDEQRWYPWFVLWTDEELATKSEKWKQDHCLRSTDEFDTADAGLASANSYNTPSNSYARIGSRLCFKSGTLATYAGQQFIDLWMDFYLIRK